MRIVGMDLSAPHIALEEREATALVRARWFAELAQQTGERALTLPEPWDPSRTAAVRLPRDALVDRSVAQPQGAVPLAPDTRHAASRTDRRGVLAPHDDADIQGDARSGGFETRAESAVAAVLGGSAIRSNMSSLRQLVAPPMSAHAARQWESLFAPIRQESAVPEKAAAPDAIDQNARLSNTDSALRQAKHRVADSVDAWFALDSQVATTTPVSQPIVQRGERSEIVVAAQSSAVLRSLQAILSDERDEVGAIRSDPNAANAAIAATQAARVLAALSSLSSPHAEPESPAARRAHKRAAAKSRAEAVVAPVASAVVAAAVPDRADASVVFAATLNAAPEAMPVDIDLMQPLITEHAVDAAPINDDEQAALAMESGPWPGVMGVDIDLAVPFAAKTTVQTTAAAPSVGDDEQAPLATQTALWPGLMGVDIDLSQPFAAEKPVAVSSPGDDWQDALAMQPPASPAAAHVDIDLSLPFVAQHTTAAASIGDGGQAPLATAPASLPMAAVREPEVDRKSRPSPFGSELVAVSEKSLDSVRGGFVTDGLNISFGIERAVYINGSLVTTTSLNMADLSRLTAGRGAPVITSGTLGLIQSGAGNTVAPGTFSSGSIGTVIQNTLDGQKIQNVTVINATTNSLGLLKGMNMESSLRGAISDSLRR